MRFNWSTRSINEWRELLKQAPRSNWMQAWPYSRALRQRDFKTHRLATIERSGKTVGFVVFYEIKLGPIHFIELLRGPLWFQDSVSLKDFLEFAKLFRSEFPNHFLRKLRWLPEWGYSEEACQFMEQVGFKKSIESYETVLLDLSSTEIELRNKFKQKWRNCLHKAERSQLSIQQDLRGKNLELFLQKYSEHKSQKNYIGPSAPFIYEEIQSAFPFREAFLLWAYHEKIDPVAGVYIQIHGKTASYRVSWNTQVGRHTNAHYLLLWKAIQTLKKIGVQTLDLGGIKSDEAPGLTHFKLGMGGCRYKLLGMWS
ncbi:MAG TPA: GNAT family N-acetyltransferase [Pseudobdellovibrionaceae bacterium]|nr:GNAT family N-acetyltransferase [Pseudobdellovibrionaceae bacterium]